MKIRKNDTVVIINGKDRGKRGRVMSVNLKSGRVLIEGANMVKRHVKSTAQARQAGIIDQPAPVQVSNVMLICPKSDKPERIGYRIVTVQEGGQPRLRKVRVCKGCNEEIDS